MLVHLLGRILMAVLVGVGVGVRMAVVRAIGVGVVVLVFVLVLVDVTGHGTSDVCSHRRNRRGWQAPFAGPVAPLGMVLRGFEQTPGRLSSRTQVERGCRRRY